MKRAILFTAVAVLLAAAMPLGAQEAPGGVRGEVLFWIQDAETKLVQLAEAIPAEKYGWRPGEGVRSVSEAFVHVASGSYFIARLVGGTIPEGLNLRGAEQSFTEKPKVVELLKQSFVHLRQTVAALPDSELDASVRLFGRDTTKRDVLLLLAVHPHEHLGQLIAYARANSIVPPWTAARQQRQQQQPQQ